MAATASQLLYFCALNRQLHHRRCSLICPTHSRQQSWISMIPKISSSSKVKTRPSYATNERVSNSYSANENQEQVQEIVSETQRASKIHDFCFGIPFGGFVLGGGLFGFIFTRNATTLATGLLFGGALLALSTCSLKIWREGRSSLPFILGQGALSAILLWKNFQTFALTKRIFPTGFYAFMSAAMLCFYLYVLLAGGNPPPKKLKSSMSVAS